MGRAETHWHCLRSHSLVGGWQAIHRALKAEKSAEAIADVVTTGNLLLVTTVRE